MAEVRNPILDHLLHIGGQLDRMEHDVREITGLGRRETDLAQSTLAEQSLRLGRPDARFTRIEKRLDLVEG